MTDQVMRPPTEAKTMVKCASLGHPMAVLMDETINKAIVGRIIGYAVGVSHTSYTDPADGQKKEIRSLVGSFKAIPLDFKRACTTSAKLGLPEHIMAPILNYLEPSDADRSKGGVTGELVQLAFDIGVERAKNAAGYSWYAVSLMGPGDKDPLAEMEKALAAPALAPERAQIEHKADKKTKAA